MIKKFLVKFLVLFYALRTHAPVNRLVLFKHKNVIFFFGGKNLLISQSMFSSMQMVKVFFPFYYQKSHIFLNFTALGFLRWWEKSFGIIWPTCALKTCWCEYFISNYATANCGAFYEYKIFSTWCTYVVQCNVKCGNTFNKAQIVFANTTIDNWAKFKM